MNQFYAGKSWIYRKEMKDLYKIIVNASLNFDLPLFDAKRKYYCEYTFTFKMNPLDASNCTAMIKMVEDLIFEKDNYNIVLGFKCESRKGNIDNLFIKVYDVEN